jgi:hypothetical protein
MEDGIQIDGALAARERLGAWFLVLEYAFGFTVAILVAGFTLWATQGIYGSLQFLASLST